jgi:hypothetical protein
MEPPSLSEYADLVDQANFFLDGVFTLAAPFVVLPTSDRNPDKITLACAECERALDFDLPLSIPDLIGSVLTHDSDHRLSEIK